MKIKTNYECIYCGMTAREYEGLEGSLYIDCKTTPDCPKEKEKGHDFQPFEDKSK